MSEEVANCRDGDNTGVIRLVNQVIWHLDMTHLPSSLECTTRGPPESPWNIYFFIFLSSFGWHTAAHLTGVSAPVLVAGTHEDLRDNLHTLDTLKFKLFAVWAVRESESEASGMELQLAAPDTGSSAGSLVMSYKSEWEK